MLMENAILIWIVSITVVIVLADIYFYVQTPKLLRIRLHHKLSGGGIVAYLLIKRMKSKADKTKATRIKTTEE